MNRLQRLDEPVDYLVTLNGADRIDPDTVLRRMVYEHPIYTGASVAAQRRLPGAEHRPHRLRRRVPRLGLPRGRLRRRRPRGRDVRRDLVTRRGASPRRDVADDRWTPVATPALYDVAIRPHPHASAAPRASSTAATCGSSTSTTSPPGGWPRTAGCRAGCARRSGSRRADHLGDPSRSIKDNVVAFARLHGVDDVARVLMLASPAQRPGRRVSYVFNPLSTHWCYRRRRLAGLPGRRGAQHLRRAARLPAAPGRRRPGGGGQGVLRLPVLRRVAAAYRMRFSAPGDRLHIAMALRRRRARRSPRPCAAPRGRRRSARCAPRPAPPPDDGAPRQRAHPLPGRRSCGCDGCPVPCGRRTIPRRSRRHHRTHARRDERPAREQDRVMTTVQRSERGTQGRFPCRGPTRPTGPAWPRPPTVPVHARIAEARVPPRGARRCRCGSCCPTGGVLGAGGKRRPGHAAGPAGQRASPGSAPT